MEPVEEGDGELALTGDAAAAAAAPLLALASAERAGGLASGGVIGGAIGADADGRSCRSSTCAS